MSRIPGYQSIAAFEREMGLAEGTGKRHMQRGYCAWPRIINDGRKSHYLYKHWRSLIDRTTVKRHTSYKNYGGRGIKVCNDWRFNFWQFVKDIESLGPKPKEFYTLDRIDNNGNYELSNVRWAHPSDQNMNQRLHKDNTSGIRGLSRTKENTWKADRQYKGVRYCKTFKRREDAIKFLEELLI